MEHVTFEDCMMQLSSIGFTTFKSVLFAQCKLLEADFLECQLKQSFFERNDMDRTKFIQTSLRGIDLSTSEFDTLQISMEDVKGAVVNQTQALGFLDLLDLTIKDT